MQKASTTVQDHNMTVAQRMWDEVWHKGNFNALDDIFDPQFVRHDSNRSELKGREQNEQFIRKLRAAFPDLRYTIDEVIASDDKVVTRYHFQGTHLGNALGFPSTGRKVNYSGILIQRFAAGKMIEQWTEADMLGLFQQLGVIPKLA